MGADLGIKLSNLIDTCHAGTPATSVELQVHKSTLCFTGRSLRNSGRAGAEVVPAGARAPPYSPPRGRRPGRRLDAARHSPDRRGTARRGIKPRADSVDSGATAPARRSIEPPDTPSLAAAGASAGQGGGGVKGRPASVLWRLRDSIALASDTVCTTQNRNPCIDTFWNFTCAFTLS